MQGCLRVTDTVYTSDLIANGAINNLLITSGDTNTTIAPLTGKSLTIQAESALYLRSIANTSIVFYEGTSQVGRFNNSGNFVIGSANANAETEKLYVYGKVKIDDSTASTAAATGALVISGGLSTGADSYLTGIHIIGQAADDPLIVRGIAGGASTGIRGTSSSEKSLYLNYTGGIVNVGKTDNSTDKLYVQYATTSTSTTTGALVVQGGVGIGEALNVSGTIHTGDLTIGGSYSNSILSTGNIYFRTNWSGTSYTTVAYLEGGNILPGSDSNNRNIGNSAHPWTNIYATNFHGALDGNATNVTGIVAVVNGGTGATIGKGAANNLMVPFLGAGVGFTNGDNIDTYTTPGTFFSTGQDQSTTLQGNVPITTTGFKLLIARTYSTNRIIQFAQKNSAEIFLRYNNTAEDSTTWGEWRKLVSIKSGTDKKTFAKIGDTDAPVYINSDGVAYACTTPFAKGNARVYYGTCTTAAGTAIKDVTCSTYDGLTIGDMITVKFTITNSATAANLKLRVNSTEEADAIPIKCQVAATISNLPAVGYLQENRPYTFVYDGANWVMMNVNRDNNDLTVRTYVLSSTTELPILAVSTNTTGGWTNYTGNKQLNGVISATTANRPTINPSTGHMTVPAGISAQNNIETTISIWAGTLGNTDTERQIGVRSGAGQFYMCSQAATDGIRGMYATAHGTGAAKWAIYVDTNNEITYDGTASYANILKRKNNNVAFTDTATVSTNGLNVMYYSALNKFSGQPSQWGYLFTVGLAENETEVHQFWVSQPNGTLYHRGTNGDTHANPPAFKAILDHRVVDSTSINNTAGSFAFSGSGAPWDRTDWVGLQIGDDVDKFQIVSGDNTLQFRQNDSGGTNTSWGSWVTMLTSGNYTSYVLSKGANLTAVTDNVARNIVLGGGASGITGELSYVSGLWYRRSDTTLKLPDNTVISCSGCKIPISQGTGNVKHYVIGVPAYSASSQILAVSSAVQIDNVGVYNAVWNDYAEYRFSTIQEPGYAITPYGKKTTQRLEAGVRVISDTYGFCVGGNNENINFAPVGLAGRVLVYPYKNKSEYKIGDAVCSAPNGTIDIMTREEIKEYPDRIIGIVNEIPNYDIWEPSRIDGNKIIHTNGRIWIDIK